MGERMAVMFIFLQFLFALLISYSLAQYSKMNTKFSFGYVPPPSEEEYFTAEDESAEELVMPNENITVILDDSQLFTLLSTLDLPRQFNEALSLVSGGASRGEESLNALYSHIAFNTYNLIAEVNTQIKSLNDAVAKIKKHLNETFQMKLKRRKDRFSEKNWAYDIFLLRAFLEIFEKAFEAGIRRKHILLPQTSIVCSLCVKPYNKPLAYGGYCPVSKCTQKVDLSAHKLMNDENIAMLADWFDDFKFKSPKEARTWEKQFLVNYLPGRFFVNITNTEFSYDSDEGITKETDPYNSLQMRSSFKVGAHKFDTTHHYGYPNKVNQEHNFVSSIHSPLSRSAPYNYNAKMTVNDGKKRMATKFAFQNKQYGNSPSGNVAMKFKPTPKTIQSKINGNFANKEKFGGMSHASHFSMSHPGYGFQSSFYG